VPDRENPNSILGPAKESVEIHDPAIATIRMGTLIQGRGIGREAALMMVSPAAPLN
jgi:hypothetical protein